MTYEIFNLHIARLQREWKNSFGEEKQKILWARLKSLPDEFMEDATTEFIANRRSAPVLDDFLLYEQEFNKRKAENRTESTGFLSGFSTLSQLEEAAKYTPNKEFAQECLKLLRDKLDGKITEEQFYQGCNLLDEAATGKNCPYCRGEGYVHERRGEEGYEFIFRCPCPLGESLPTAKGPKRPDGTREEITLATYQPPEIRGGGG